MGGPNIQVRRPGCPAGAQRGGVRHKCFLNLEAYTDPSPSSPAIHHLSPAQSISRCPRGFHVLHVKISRWQVIPALHSHPPHFTLPVILLPTHSLFTASKCVPTSTPPELKKTTRAHRGIHTGLLCSVPSALGSYAHDRSNTQLSSMLTFVLPPQLSCRTLCLTFRLQALFDGPKRIQRAAPGLQGRQVYCTCAICCFPYKCPSTASTSATSRANGGLQGPQLGDSARQSRNQCGCLMSGPGHRSTSQSRVQKPQYTLRYTALAPHLFPFQVGGLRVQNT